MAGWLGVEGENRALVASHQEDGRQVPAHGLQPAHVALSRHATLRHRDSPVEITHTHTHTH